MLAIRRARSWICAGSGAKTARSREGVVRSGASARPAYARHGFVEVAAGGQTQRRAKAEQREGRFRSGGQTVLPQGSLTGGGLIIQEA
jgi:hypothetical protein